jgi:hypothetical protein
MANLTDAPDVPIPYASPQAPAPARFGPVLVLLAGLLLVILSILPWGMVVAAFTGGLGSSGRRETIVGIFSLIGSTVLLTGLWLIFAATRRLLR